MDWRRSHPGIRLRQLQSTRKSNRPDAVRERKAMCFAPQSSEWIPAPTNRILDPD